MGGRGRPRAPLPSRGALLVASCLALAGCDDARFPKDPDGTLESVLASGEITVAAAAHPPWVTEGRGPPSGAEAALVEEFARDLGVSVVWRRLSAMEALEALEQGEADLAIGGFDRTAVMSQDTAAPSYAYLKEALVVAARPGAPVPEDLDGHAVHVSPDAVASDLVRREGGTPVSDPAGADLVALPDWQVAESGLAPTGIVLDRREHVIAVPKGENAWLMRLERFLRARSGAVPDLLREHAG